MSAVIPPPTTGQKVAAGSAAAILSAMALVMAWEGDRHDAYQDVAGIWTACYGHAYVPQGARYTEAQCRDLLTGDLHKAQATVEWCIPNKMPPQVEGALISATYNAGPKVVCGSTIQRKAKASDWRGVCDGLLAWHYVAGKPVQGLLNRRQAERKVCLQGVPS